MKLVLDGLTVMQGGRTVLDGLDLTIPEGAFVGVLGPNGAGKTTLFRTILGLLPHGGRIVGAPDAIGYMPQSRTLAAPRLLGREIIAGAVRGERWGMPWLRRGDREDISRVLALVDAAPLADRPIGALSGGERQRLLLAQALLGRPGLLLLDEPLQGLDPRRQQEVVHLVASLTRTLGITVLFSAHEVNPLLGAIDQVLYLGGGKAAIGRVEDVITGPVLSRLYGSDIDVVHVNGRIFVMAGAHAAERPCEEARHVHL